MASRWAQLLRRSSPRTGRVIREDGTEINTADVLNDFHQMQTVTFTNLFDLKSIYGISKLRDVVTETGTGTVTATASEFVCSGSASGDVAEIRSAERGRYVAGTVGLAGCGVRVVRKPQAAGDVIEWGYFLNGQEGFGFGLDVDGLYTFTRDNSVDKVKRYQKDWIADTLSGSGPSRKTLNLLDGNVFRLPYIWYGYGAIRFDVLVADDRRDHLVCADAHVITGGTTIKDPNLPVTLRVGGNCEATIAGRQYGIYGNYDPRRRVVGDYRLAQSVGDAAWVPAITFRVKDSDPFRSVSTKLAGLDILSDTDVLWAIRLGGTLDSTVFNNPEILDAGESATEYNTDATTVSGGQQLTPGIAAGGSGNQKSLTPTVLPDFEAPVGTLVTVVLKSTGGAATVTTALRDRQEF